MTHPYIITEGMQDGSDAVADWPLLDALLLTASGADLVAVHAGGGGYAGYSVSAGVTVVADGTRRADARLDRALGADTALGVLRHADAGYDEAIACARGGRAGTDPRRHDERARGHAVEAAVAGGSVLAAGGGGWVDHGYLVGRTALATGRPAWPRSTRSPTTPRSPPSPRSARRPPATGRCARATTSARCGC